MFSNLQNIKNYRVIGEQAPKKFHIKDKKKIFIYVAIF